VEVGLTGSMVIVVKDLPLHWVTRFAQGLGIAYRCVAVLNSLRETGTNGSPLAPVEEAWGEKDFLAGLRNQTPLAFMLRYGFASKVSLCIAKLCMDCAATQCQIVSSDKF
jgi:hypothetical protein